MFYLSGLLLNVIGFG
ncbi:hypothetical protein [Erwinia pyrifoliae]